MKDLLLYAKMPKATYMYWQKRFDRVNPDKKIEENIGLKNVHQRLKLLYGEGLNITKLEQGTRIKFKILGGVKYD